MTAQKTRILLNGYFFLVFFILTAGCNHPAGNNAVESPAPDLIMLDAMQRFGSLERPTVIFPHDRHTALLKDKGGCQACHQQTDKGLLFTFVSLTGMSERTAMNSWHDRCIGCHERSLDEGAAAGPLTCGECHPKKQTMPPAVQTPNFYDTYHELHEDLAGGCGLCHHEYNPTTGRLYYEEGGEIACRECHMETRQDNTPSLKTASHLSCVNCHLETAAEEEMALPLDCTGCHESGPAPVE